MFHLVDVAEQIRLYFSANTSACTPTTFFSLTKLFSLCCFFLSDEGPMLETLDHTIRIGSTPTFLYFDLYLQSAYAAHYVYYLYTSMCKPFCTSYSIYSVFTIMFYCILIVLAIKYFPSGTSQQIHVRASLPIFVLCV